MKKFLLGLAALGLGALGAQTAEAQPYYPAYRHHPPVAYRPAPRPVVHPRPAYRPAFAYQAYRPGPRCWVRPERTWNGFMWVNRPVRVCR